MKVYCKICTSAVAKLFNMHQTAFGKITTISEYKCALYRNWPSTDFPILITMWLASQDASAKMKKMK